ncbi:hydroxyacid dehydrogenase [Gracilibacillus salinarum]|uniref:Hydroxyacid dehydrogenase n=1 Tax=Gracilibacillus salinarum TaxID=2932255 RepID=A0ABY4GR97_9BACI|nr:hydroxyacid dehydrogenase [Gracilibacillus salinarum]UOQ86923.1 hydroxyacid dehydrogenase [Gracilibacillus salinarum]
MLKGLYIMNERSFDLVYPADVRNEIEEIVDIYAPPLTSQSLREDLSILQEAECLFTGWGAPELTRDLLEKAPNLKVIFYAAGSIKKIATDAFWKSDVKITTAAEANAIPVQEFTLSQVLFCLKNGWQYVKDIRINKAYPEKPYSFSGAYNSTAGIISLSKIGRGVCELLKPFEINLLAYDPFVSEQEAELLGVSLCSLDDLFSKSDVVSLHAPLLEETRELIKREHFKLMKPNAAFINTARGAIVKEAEMIEVLQERKDITAVLDVTFPEPPPLNSVLYTMPNVVLTPHLAGSQGEECGRMGNYMLEELKKYVKGEKLQWQVNYQAFIKQA